MAFITAEKTRALTEQRAAPRRRVSIGSWVISLDGALVQPCQTRDVSAKGVRVHFKEAQRLPGTLFYLDMKDRIAYEAAEVVVATGHRDPGDCYLIATARVKKIPIVTRDAIMQAHASSGYLDIILC